MNTIEPRLAAVESRLSGVETSLAQNTALTQHVVDTFGSLEAGFKVLGVIGRVARWAAPIISLVAAVWALLHGKFPGGE